jgi:microcystin-dependent protein
MTERERTDRPYIGEIRLFGGTFAPPGWVLCDGRELPIDGDYAELYAAIGTTFGGRNDSFAVPDLRGAPPGEITPPGTVSFIMAVTGIRPARPFPE